MLLRGVATGVAAGLLAGVLGGCMTSADPARPPDGESGGSEISSVRGVDVDLPNFVPQGLALAQGGGAWLSGYDWPRPGRRNRTDCRVVLVDRKTGDIRRGQIVDGCRHGGGAALTKEGLWVAGSARLWLLDPAQVGRGDRDPVLRTWRIDDPVHASTLTVQGDDLILVTFEKERGRVHRYPIATLMAADRVPANSGRAAPRRVQGVAPGPGGLWFASSTTYCGVLTDTDGTTHGFLPGAEGFEVDDGVVWVVSESGSGPYQRQDRSRPDVPTLNRVALADVRAGLDTGCTWHY